MIDRIPEGRSVHRACAVLEVSCAAYYEWPKQACWDGSSSLEKWGLNTRWAGTVTRHKGIGLWSRAVPPFPWPPTQPADKVAAE